MKAQLNLVQILRGFAAISVMLYHLDDQTKQILNHVFFHFGYGYLGVDFFFTLSGFIITYIHIKDVQERGSVKYFAIKRIIRIYPLYWLVLIIALLLRYPAFAEKPNLHQSLDLHTAPGWLNLMRNFLLLPMPLQNMPLGVAWTLICEMGFYAVFAIAIAAGWKTTKWILFLWTVIILLYSRDVLPRTIVGDTYTGAKIIEFLFGCIAGYLFRFSAFNFTAVKSVISLSAVSAVCILYLSWHDFNPNSILLTTLMGAAAAILILFSAQTDRKNNYSRRWSSVLLGLGNASYSIYLTHGLIIAWLLKGLTLLPAFTEASVVVFDIIIAMIAALTLVMGWLIHIMVEKPLLSALNRWRRPATPTSVSKITRLHRFTDRL